MDLKMMLVIFSGPYILHGSFPKQSNPNIDPIYYNPYSTDHQKGTSNFGKPTLASSCKAAHLEYTRPSE